jgi:tetratricopeptide (TPR) repeat protein
VPAKVADVARLLQYLKQGMTYASQKRYDAALAEFQQALAIDRNFLGLNQNVGAAQLALKKYAEAETSLRAEVKLVDCLAPLNESQLAPFAYYIEVEEKDPQKRRAEQASRLKKDVAKAKADANYNLACLYSVKKDKDPALSALRAAIDAGFSNKQALRSDADLAFIRQTPEFRDIVAKAQ